MSASNGNSVSMRLTARLIFPSCSRRHIQIAGLTQRTVGMPRAFSPRSRSRLNPARRSSMKELLVLSRRPSPRWMPTISNMFEHFEITAHREFLKRRTHVHAARLPCVRPHTPPTTYSGKRSGLQARISSAAEQVAQRFARAIGMVRGQSRQGGSADDATQGLIWVEKSSKILSWYSFGGQWPMRCNFPPLVFSSLRAAW